MSINEVNEALIVNQSLTTSNVDYIFMYSSGNSLARIEWALNSADIGWQRRKLARNIHITYMYPSFN